MNIKYTRLLASLLVLIFTLSAIAIVPVVADETASAEQGTPVISEICAAPTNDNYEYVEVVALNGNVTLGDYSICRFGFSHSGVYGASGFSQIMGVTDPLADLDIVDLPSATINKGTVAILWFVPTGSTLTESQFRSTWSLDTTVQVIKVTHSAPATNVNTSAGSNFLPNIKVGFALSLIRTELIPSTVNLRETVKDTATGTAITTYNILSHDPYTTIPVKSEVGTMTTTYGVEPYETRKLQDQSDCVALYYTDDTKDTDSHHYNGFVDPNSYGAATLQKTFYAMDDTHNAEAKVVTPSANVLAVYDTNGYTDIKAYWNGTYSGADDANETGFTFVADGKTSASTPGKLSSSQLATVDLSVPVAQNKVCTTSQDVRFIGWVDSLNYKEIGIRVTAAYVSGDEKLAKDGAQSISTTKVYTSVKGGDKEYTTDCAEISKGGEGYLMAVAVTGIDISDDTHIIFYLTPFGVIDSNGTETTVYGKTSSAVLNGTKLTPPTSSEYRIMSFNVLRANQRDSMNYEAALKGITDYDADVVGFQEYCAAFTANLTPKLIEAGYTVIGNAEDVNHTDTSGNTLYEDQNMTPLAYKKDKFNCLASGAARVYGTYDPNKEFSNHAKNYPGHWITWAVLEDRETGEVFAVATTHGFHNSNQTLQNPGQLDYHVPAMIDTFYDLMNNAEAKAVKGGDFICPVIFVGDYNMKTTSEPYAALFSGFISDENYDASYGVLADSRFVALQGYTSGKAGHTLGTANRTANNGDMIDHIVVTEAVGVIDHKICVSETTTAASDHYPVYVDIVLSAQ